MFKPGLVSVISPCYNIARYIPFFFESLLAQTYKHLEIILVNDGSTDETGQVIREWLPKLEGAGYSTKYIVKVNGGQTSAINEALPHFSGEFLTWVDPDDILYSESIAKKVEFLTTNPQLSFVRTECDIFHEKDRNKIIGVIRGENRTILSENIILDLIFEKTYVTCHCYLVRSEAFIEVNPNRKIYERKDAGQNWQMLLPIANKYDCGYLPLALCGYIVREGSHYHSNKSISAKLDFLDMSFDVINKTLQSIDIDHLSINKELDIHFLNKRYKLGLEYKDRNIVLNELSQLKKIHRLTSVQEIERTFCKFSCTFFCVVALDRTRSKLKRIVNKILGLIK